MENWKEVKEFEGRILISDLGRVKEVERDYIIPQHLTGKYYKVGRGYPTVFIRKPRSFRKVHRMVAEAFLDEWDSSLMVDHKDGDTMNNKLSNLRMVTALQNKMGAKKARGISGFRGVSWHKTKKRWEAEMNHDGTRTFLGGFSKKEDAASAWNKKAVDLGFFKEALNNV